MKDQALARPMFAQMAQSIDNLEQQIDNAEDYAGIMNAIRGDEATVAERRQELGGLVGKKDANKTPESVLTLIQPTLGIMETAQEGGMSADGVGITSGLTEQAPGQAEAKARIAMGEQPVKRAAGSGPIGEIFAQEFGSDPLIAERTRQGLMSMADLFGTTVPQAGTGVTNTRQAVLNQLLANVPAAKTTADFLPEYRKLYADAEKAYDLNPAIAGLNLGAIIANAPRGGLLQALLNPESIKAVSDPILEMAKAKGQSDLLARKGAMEAAQASASEERKAKQAILTAGVPKLLEQSALKTEKIGDTLYVIDEDAMRAAHARGEQYTPLSLEGKPKPEFVTIRLNDTQTVTTNKLTGQTAISGEGTIDWKQVTTKDGDVIFYDPKNPKNYKTIIEGEGAVLGNMTDGFVRVKDGTVTPIEVEGLTFGDDERTELMKNSQRLGELTALERPTVAEVAELKALTNALIPEEEKGEFERVLGRYIENYKDQLSGLGVSMDDK